MIDLAKALGRDSWREVTAGAGFTEGPVAVGDAVVFVSINRGRLYRVPLAGGERTAVAEVGGGPNGIATDGEERLWVAQNGGRVMQTRSWSTPPALQVVTGDRAVFSFEDDRLNAPNACAFGPDGRLWFTDPYRPQADDTVAQSAGRVWAYNPTRAHFEIIADGLAHPNGLCFTDDGGLLVSDTADRTILRFERVDGCWEPTGVHARLPWGRPDGMAMDEGGRLWVTTTTGDGLAVLDPDGRWTFVDIGAAFATNVCFAGVDRKTVVVTAARGGRILACDVDVPGLTLAAPAELAVEGKPPQ